jgi:putative methionine-R-sulfoxide reductase with GAF domain
VTAKSDAYRAAVDAVDRMVNRGDDADAVLRAVVDLLHDRLDHCSRVSIFLVEEGDLALGPSRGSREAQGSELAVPIAYEERQVGELRVESAAPPEAFDDEDRRSLERIATLISQHALVAWDTRGKAWDP